MPDLELKSLGMDLYTRPRSLGVSPSWRLPWLPCRWLTPMVNSYLEAWLDYAVKESYT